MLCYNCNGRVSIAKKNTYSAVWAFFGLKKNHEDDNDFIINFVVYVEPLYWCEEEAQAIYSATWNSPCKTCFDQKEQEKEIGSKQRQSR